jgi:hypothetical protein
MCGEALLVLSNKSKAVKNKKYRLLIRKTAAEKQVRNALFIFKLKTSILTQLKLHTVCFI